MLFGSWEHSHDEDISKQRIDNDLKSKIVKMAKDGVETTKMRLKLSPTKNLEPSDKEKRRPGPNFFYNMKRQFGDFPFKSKSKNVFEGLMEVCEDEYLRKIYIPQKMIHVRDGGEFVFPPIYEEKKVVQEESVVEAEKAGFFAYFQTNQQLKLFKTHHRHLFIGP